MEIEPVESTTKVTDVGAEAESMNIVPNITVKWGTLVEGIGQTFAGIAKMLTALDPHMSKTIAEMVAEEQAKAETGNREVVDENAASKVAEAVPLAEQHEEPVQKDEKAESRPAGKEQQVAAQTAAPAQVAAPIIKLDDVTKVIVQKIKQNRGNNEKIGSILKTYGVGKVSELPQEKYEAFLTDLAQL